MSPHDPPTTTTIWQAISRCLMWAVSIVCVCICLALFKPQMNRRAVLDAHIAALRTEKDALRDREAGLRRRAQWIRDEPGFFEVQARDWLDVAREGETIFHFQEPGR